MRELDKTRPGVNDEASDSSSEGEATAQFNAEIARLEQAVQAALAKRARLEAQVAVLDQAQPLATEPNMTSEAKTQFMQQYPPKEYSQLPWKQFCFQWFPKMLEVMEIPSPIDFTLLAKQQDQPEAKYVFKALYWYYHCLSKEMRFADTQNVDNGLNLISRGLTFYHTFQRYFKTPQLQQKLLLLKAQLWQAAANNKFRNLANLSNAELLKISSYYLKAIDILKQLSGPNLIVANTSALEAHIQTLEAQAQYAQNRYQQLQGHTPPPEPPPQAAIALNFNQAPRHQQNNTQPHSEPPRKRFKI